MEFVSFQNVNHFVPKQAEKEQKQSADRESFQDIMKKAPEQAQTEKEQKDVSKSEKKDPIVQNGNFVLQSQLLIVQAPVQAGRKKTVIEELRPLVIELRDAFREANKTSGI